MPRIITWLTIVTVVLAVSAPAWATWIWRDGRWVYVDPREPPLPGPGDVPKAPPKPIKPSPAPPEAPESPAPPPKAEPPAPAPKTAPPAPPRTEPPARPPEARPPAEPGEAAEKPPWWRLGLGGETDKSLFEEGRSALAAGSFGPAGRTLKKLIKNHAASPYREEAMWLRASALVAQKELFNAFDQYEELLTQYAGSPHYRDALLKEIEIAERFLGGERRRILGVPLLPAETEAVEIFRKVYEHQPAGDLADDVVLRIADYYWSKQKWPEAEDYYDKYCREYANGDAVLRAEFRRAKCAIERCRGPRYDVTSLQLAYDRLRQFQEKFPQAAEGEGVPALLAEVRDRQAEALYAIAARYRRAGQPLAAAFYAERLRERFPDSPWSEKAKAFLVEGAARPSDGQAQEEPSK